MRRQPNTFSMQVPMLTVPVAAADADDESPAAAAEAAGQPAPVSLPTGTLTVDLSTQLHQFWKTAEGTYLTTVTNILAHLRCSREAATLWFRDHRQQYVAFLERDAPSKHKLVSCIHARSLMPCHGTSFAALAPAYGLFVP